MFFGLVYSVVCNCTFRMRTLVIFPNVTYNKKVGFLEYGIR